MMEKRKLKEMEKFEANAREKKPKINVENTDNPQYKN